MSKYHAIMAMQRIRRIAIKRASRRWELDRKRRETLAAIDPVRLGGVVRRIIVIDHETTAREIVFYAHDRYIDRKRKLQSVKALAYESASTTPAVS